MSTVFILEAREVADWSKIGSAIAIKECWNGFWLTNLYCCFYVILIPFLLDGDPVDCKRKGLGLTLAEICST
jgi:hypothetical protein